MKICEDGTAVVLTGVTKTYRRRAPVSALAGVDLTIAEGEMAAVTGASGSGKSTLLSLIGGLDVPTEGRVVVFGSDVSMLDEDARSRFRRRHVAYVFQSFHLMPTLSCRDNVAMPLYLQGMARAEVDRRVDEALEAVDLRARSRHLPDELSGGESQRVAIARALASQPRLLLADEPTGNLDSSTGRTILDHLDAIHRDRRATVVIVTHDPGIADRCHRIIHLQDGRIDADTRA